MPKPYPAEFRRDVIAVARKLLVALWRYLTTGLVPEGARLKMAVTLQPCASGSTTISASLGAAIGKGPSLDADELIAFTRTRLARYKCPQKVMFVDELPHGATGKVLRQLLRAQA